MNTQMQAAPPNPRNRREHILHVALQLIAEHGCDGLSHRKIAAAAKVPLGSTTYYFASREDLLLEAFRLYIREFGQRLQTQMDALRSQHTQDPARLIAQFFGQLLAAEIQQISLLRAEQELIVYSAKLPTLAAEFNAWETSLHTELSHFLDALQLPKPASLATALMRLIRGAEVQALTQGQMNYLEFHEQIQALIQGYLWSENHV